jgi:5-deoxy-glucuronate isomerase
MLYKAVKEKRVLVPILAAKDLRLSIFRGTRGDFLRLEGTGMERLLFTLAGEAKVDGELLATRDMIYIPPREPVSVSFAREADLYIAETESDLKGKRFVKRFLSAPSLESGTGNYRRTITVMVGVDDPAGRFLAGYTEGEPGCWTSYPPHRHDNKPEIYIFYGVGNGFGVQMLLDEEREEAYIVRDHDVVFIEKGYHPNVATTLAGICYAWIIAAPPGHRDLSVEIHPAFTSVSLPKTHLKITPSARV